MTKRSRTKGQTTTYKPPHGKLKNEQHNPTKTRGELRCSGMVSSFCSTSDTRRVTLVTNPMVNHELRQEWEVLTISGSYPGHL